MAVAWMRMMGAASVDYHRDTVLKRGDDHPGLALDYYASRGETPLVWGGAGAERLGLTGAVTEEQYDALYGPGGACDPTTGRRLVNALRPGVELVVAADKSVAVLGVIGRAEHMHQILDAETDGTLAFLDLWAKTGGGRRGRAQVRTATSGLVYARTRHATSRAGDPAPHDHVLVANVVEMLDSKGGWKGLDTAGLRDMVHAATAFGRVVAAAKAVELGYGIEANNGPSGKLGHWRIAGIPTEACDLFSKRSAEIDLMTEAKGYTTYQARGVAARDTRKAKRHTPVDALLPTWVHELEQAGFTVDGLNAALDHASAERRLPAERLSTQELAAIVTDALGPDGRLAEMKVFTRADVFVAVAPKLFGRHPGELARVVDAVLANPNAIPLIGVAAARDRAYTPACVLATEAAIAANVAGLAARHDAPVVHPTIAEAAIATKEQTLGRALTTGQREAVMAITTSGRGAEVVVGVAGSGKTTLLDVARQAFEAAGYRVLGTSTSGQAARTLGREAGIESRTVASLLWRLDHDQLRLDRRTVVIVDEAGMTDDPSILRLLAAAEDAHAKVVLVGDHRQLGAVGPGGALEAVIARHPDAVHPLRENVRQHDPDERRALAHLRAGEVTKAVEWYRDHDRIRIAPTRDDALADVIERWAADVAVGADTEMRAWRRANVGELNRLARHHMTDSGRLSGPELVVGGRGFRAGDWIVTLAPGADGHLVTSERGVVHSVDVAAGTLVARMDDGRHQPFGADQLTADHVAYGYAVTVHRCQGDTGDRGHRFFDGGGRELGYVSMSRDRETSHIYVVADDVDQAVEDLIRDWSSERRQLWAIDSGTPAVGALAVEDDTQAPAPMRTALRRARLQAERDAIVAAVPADPTFQLRRAEADLQAARQDRQDLEWGRGRWAGTREGVAARAVIDANANLHRAQGFAQGGDWRTRRHWSGEARRWGQRLEQAHTRFADVAGVDLAGLDQTIAGLERQVHRFTGDLDVYQQWHHQHPEIGARLARLDHDIARIDRTDPISRLLDRAVETAQARHVDPGWGHALDHAHQPPPPERGFGIEL